LRDSLKTLEIDRIDNNTIKNKIDINSNKYELISDRSTNNIRVKESTFRDNNI